MDGGTNQRTDKAIPMYCLFSRKGDKLCLTPDVVECVGVSGAGESVGTLAEDLGERGQRVEHHQVLVTLQLLITTRLQHIGIFVK